MIFTLLILCIALGSLAGFLAGILGIGGGLVIVPALIYLLPLVDVPQHAVMPMAIGTSLSTIMITSISATVAHYRNQNIPEQLTRALMPAVASGALIGAFIADSLSTIVLTNIFSTIVILLACYMLMSISLKAERNMPSITIIQCFSVITGIIASIMGIAGGAILVPLLTYFGVPIRHSIGVATVCGVMVAFFGSLGFVITGYGLPMLPKWSLGYIYLPALLGIVISSSITAPIGVKYASKLPIKTLQKCFAVFLICIALKMLFTA